MNSAILEKTSFKLDWITILRRIKKVAAFIIVFALGGWITSIRDHASDHDYRDRQTAKAEQVERVAGANPVAIINCLKKKSAIATTLAKQAVKVAEQESDVGVPDLSSIPNCPQTAAPK